MEAYCEHPPSQHATESIHDGIRLHTLVGCQHVELVEPESSCDHLFWQDSDSETSGSDLASTCFACYTGNTPSGLGVDKTLYESEHSTLSMSIDELQLDHVQELAYRAFTLGSLLELVCVLLDRDAAFNIIEDLEAAYLYHSSTPLDHWPDLSFFDPATTQTREITYRFLVPLSQRRQCAFANILTGHQGCLAKRMVSHTWDSVFLDTVAACVAAAQGMSCFFHLRPRLRCVSRVQELMQDLGPENLTTPLWLCALSINQHTVACHQSPWPCPCDAIKVTEGPFSEVGCFHWMMQYLHEAQQGFSQVIVVDDETLLRVDISMGDKIIWKNRPAHFGKRSRHRTSDTSYGFQVNWYLRCVISPTGVSGAIFSRSLCVGDIIESVNGSNDVSVMRNLLANRVPVTMVVRRSLSVTTRIWVVAEIAEAHRRKIPQHVVSHFPMTLSGPAHKLRVKAANVAVAEASKESDRKMILARIGTNADDYNRRLKSALLASPIEWKLLLGFAIGGVYLLLLSARAFFALKNGEHAVAHLSNVWWVFILGWAFCCMLRYFWMMSLVNNVRISDGLCRETHEEVCKYFEPWRNPLWTRPFLLLGLVWSPSWTRRAAACIFVWLVAFFPTSVAQAAGHSEMKVIPMCQEAPWLGIQLFFNNVASLSCMWAVMEQRSSLSRRGPTMFLVLLAPMILFWPTYIGFCSRRGALVVIFNVLLRACTGVLLIDVLRRPLFQAMLTFRRQFAR